VHGHANGIKTAVLIAAMSGLILLAGLWVGGSAGLALALAISLVVNGVAYFHSDKLALRSMRARPVSEAEQPEIYRIVRELSTAARQPMPRLYVSPTQAPNAFATGRNPRHAAVCCTEGILAILDERELRGVLGHELSHVYNRDILISSVAAGLASVMMYLTYLVWFLPGGSEDDDGPGPLGFLLLLVVGPLAAGVIQMAISRSREFQADASGAAVTGDPLALASALRKLELGTRALPLPPEPRLQTTSSMMIANPFRHEGVANWFSTHPPMAERIARLEQLAGYPR
jgi:heat shock protein HtpX